MSFEKLIGHVGQNVEVVTYGPDHGEPVNVAFECLDCGAVLADADRDAGQPECAESEERDAQVAKKEITVSTSERLNELASLKDSSALGDEADGGFGEANIEEQDFEGCVIEGVALAEKAMLSGSTQVWEVKHDHARFYFVGTQSEVVSRIRALPER